MLTYKPLIKNAGKKKIAKKYLNKSNKCSSEIPIGRLYTWDTSTESMCKGTS
jgi:hypothetical protein